MMENKKKSITVGTFFFLFAPRFLSVVHQTVSFFRSFVIIRAVQFYRYENIRTTTNSSTAFSPSQFFVFEILYPNRIILTGSCAILYAKRSRVKNTRREKKRKRKSCNEDEKQGELGRKTPAFGFFFVFFCTHLIMCIVINRFLKQDLYECMALAEF